MKSWSLGRKAGKKEKNRGASLSSPEASPRPKSLVMSLPNTSSGTELSSSVQASPSLTYSARSRKFSHENDDDSLTATASKYLSKAQHNDKVRREKTMTTSRPPLSAKNNMQESETRTRTTSLPSLMKSPSVASPTPSTALLSPAEAVVVGSQHSHDLNGSGDGNPFNDSASFDSLPTPPSPSPSPRPAALTPLGSDSIINTSSLDNGNSTLQTSKHHTPRSKAIEIPKKVSKDEDVHDSALASLRRFKGVEGYGLLDKAKATNMNSLTVKETTEQQQTEQGQIESSEADQPKYSFAVRKVKRSTTARGQLVLSKQRPKQVEAKYDLAIVSQSAHSWSFDQARTKQMAARRIIAIPIPSVLGCDRVAGWTVERLSRLTSCVIQVFGS